MIYWNYQTTAGEEDGAVLFGDLACHLLPERKAIWFSEEEDMKNVTRIVGVTVVIALLLVVGFTASAGRLSRAPADTPVPPAAAPETSSDPEEPPPTAEAILSNAVEILDGMESWHVDADMDVTVQLNGLALGIPVSFSGDYAAPDRLEGTMSVPILGLPLKKDVVLIANTVSYIDPKDSQSMTSAEMGTMFSLLDFVGFDPSRIKDLEVVGQETMDEIPVYHLRGSLTAGEMRVEQGGQEVTLQGEIRCDMWVGIIDGLPHRMMFEGKLVASGAVPGILRVAGSSSCSGYVWPEAVEPPGQSMAQASGPQCDTEGNGLMAYSSEAAAIHFCHSSDWVVDDVVDACGSYVVSPTGVVPPNQVPGSMVLIFPPKTLEQAGQSAVGAVQLAGRTGICACQLVRGSVLGGESPTASNLQQGMADLLTRGFLRQEPMVVTVTGIQYAGAKALAASYLLDAEMYGSTVEGVISSIVPGRPAEP